MGTVLGLDLGIKTGALARVKVNETYNIVEKQKILFSWTQGPKIKSSLDQDILKFFNQNLASWIQFDLGETLAIDWDISEIYWAANKRNTNTITFVCGYLTSLAHQRGINVLHLSPKKIRTFFGLTGQRSKSEIQRHFLNMPRIFEPRYRGVDTDHELDAIILAYVADLKTRGMKCSELFYYDQWSCKI